MGILPRVGAFFLAACLAGASPASASPLTLEVVDADVTALLTSIARLSGLDLILDDSVKGRISLSLKDVEPEEALMLIGKAKGLVVQHEGKVLLVRAAKEATPFYRMHVLPVRYADLDTAFAAVKLSLGEAGIFAIDENKKNGKEDISEQGLYRTGERLLIDRATNALLFYGTEEERVRAEAVLHSLDVPTEQVSLEARVVALEKNAAKELGVDWSWSALPQYPRVRRGDDGAWEVGGRNAGNEGTSAPGIIRFGRGPEGVPFEFYYSAAIRALITDGRAKMLARPNITTVQGHEALINIGAEVPVPRTTTSNTVTTTGIDYREAGIILRYTPRVTADRSIVARVHTEVSTPVYVEDLKAYRFQKRSANTTVRLRDGETMVIGGLIDSDESRSLSKIPFLGDLPILGAFFRSVRTSKTETELMIFLTAHVLDEG